MTYLPPSTTDHLCFGEICAAGFLRDVYARADCVELHKTQQPARLARQFGIDDALDAWVPAPPAPGHQDHRYALAHGEAWSDYVVLSDDCVTARYFRFDRGRVLLAPVRRRQPTDPDDIASLSSFDLFPLPADDVHAEDGVVLLANAFGVEARDLKRALAAHAARLTRLRMLDMPTRDLLLRRWSAHSCRRGPLVQEDNSGKLGDLIAGHHVDDAAVDELVDELADMADVIWDYEARLEAFSDLHERVRLGQAPLVQPAIEDLSAAAHRVEQRAASVRRLLDNPAIRAVP